MLAKSMHNAAAVNEEVIINLGSCGSLLERSRV